MKIKRILIAVLCMGFLFAGCGADDGKENAVQEPDIHIEMVTDRSLLTGSSYFMDFGDEEVMTMEETAILEGKLRAAFGEPSYESENYENSISYIIKVTEPNGQNVILEVYNAGMLHIGTPKKNDLAKTAAQHVIAYVKMCEPVDYEKTVYYLDYDLQIDISVKNGIATVEQSEISDEKASELAEEWWG